MNKKWLVIVTLMILAILLMPKSIEWLAHKNALSKSTPKGARAACQDFVREKLKYPRSARFDADLDVITTVGGDDFQITGSLSAKGGFGNMRATLYVCRVTFYEGKWYLVDLDVIDPLLRLLGIGQKWSTATESRSI